MKKQPIDEKLLRRCIYYMGLKGVKEKEASYRFFSPLRENKKRSMAIYKNPGKIPTVKDFGSDYSASIYTFFKDVTGQTIKDVFGYKETTYEEPIKKKEKEELRIEAVLRDIHDNETVMSYCRSRGMGDTFLNELNVHNYFRHGVIDKRVYTDRLVIPIIESKKIISYELRDYTRKQSKKTLYPSGVSVSTLYNIDNLREDRPLFVVEGIMDTIKIYEHISKNVTCTFGISVNQKQKDLLKKFDIIVIPDDDEGGNKFIENLNKFMPTDFLVARVKGKDPNDASIDELESAIATAKYSNEVLLDNYNLFPETMNLV